MNLASSAQCVYNGFSKFNVCNGFSSMCADGVLAGKLFDELHEPYVNFEDTVLRNLAR